MNNKMYYCDSKGDKEFSALYAKVRLSSGKVQTVEYCYQVLIKGYPSIKVGKGKPGLKYNYRQQKIKYFKVWRLYLEQNPHLLKKLKELRKKGYVFVDRYAKKGAVNQADVLTVLTNQRKMYTYSKVRQSYLETVATTRKEALRNFQGQMVKLTGNRDSSITIKTIKEDFEKERK